MVTGDGMSEAADAILDTTVELARRTGDLVNMATLAALMADLLFDAGRRFATTENVEAFVDLMWTKTVDDVVGMVAVGDEPFRHIVEAVFASAKQQVAKHVLDQWTEYKLSLMAQGL